jgi:hypothetical protein
MGISSCCNLDDHSTATRRCTVKKRAGEAIPAVEKLFGPTNAKGNAHLTSATKGIKQEGVMHVKKKNFRTSDETRAGSAMVLTFLPEVDGYR